ncbi:GmrSD restriction endonuclease domain-containing protein [Nesterenkonia populi]
MENSLEKVAPEDAPEVHDESEADDRLLIETSPSTLPYFGADFDLAGLVRRLQEGDIVIPRFDPDESHGLSIDGFQRQRVWDHGRMSTFIETLLLGWPVPSIFLLVEPDGRYLVLDGQQRLTTLQKFYEGEYPDGREFALKNVEQHLEGATYASLSAKSRRRLNNTFIQAVVIEPEGKEGKDSVYRLFGRLNSGGVSLAPQEIRVALYRGPLVDLIRSLNHDNSWRHLFGAPHRTLKDHELILRSLAMVDVLDRVDGRWQDEEVRRTAYKPPMARFLNSYLEREGELVSLNADDIENAFSDSCRLLVEANGRDGLKFSGRLNAAHIDAILGSLMFGVLRGRQVSKEQVHQGIGNLREDEAYEEWVSKSTSHRDSVYGRLEKASKALLG